MKMASGTISSRLFARTEVAGVREGSGVGLLFPDGTRVILTIIVRGPRSFQTSGRRFTVTEEEV
jgi:hypothetical protein